MNHERDDAIEALLRGQFEGPIDDEGFSARVLRHLPPPRRRTSWPLWAGTAVGGVACWLTLLPSRLLSHGWQDWVGGHWSAAGVLLLAVMGAMLLLAMAWSVAEAVDR